MSTPAATAIRETLVVDAPIDRAFSVFTDGLGTWFPREYNLLETEIAERTFEPRVGGSVYDRGTDGSECHWGRVRAYEPPERVVFSWNINPRWSIEDDPEQVSEVEVRFTEEEPGRTRVELEHRHLERHGEGWEQLREQLAAEGGWSGVLRGYAAQVAG